MHAVMAIKGKKRSRQRGSQGARRPAQAPKPTVVGSRRGPAWYRSPLSIGVVAVFGLVLVGIVIAVIYNVRENAQETDDRRALLEEYTDDVSAVLQSANSAANELGALAVPPRGEELSSLSEEAEAWIATFEETQGSLAQVITDERVTGVNQLFNEGLALFASSARTMATLPDVDDRATRTELFTQAATVRDTANALFTSAISVLNLLREDVDLGSSGLQAPILPTSGQPPVTSPEGTEEIVIPGEGEPEGEGNENQERPEDGGGGGGG